MRLRILINILCLSSLLFLSCYRVNNHTWKYLKGYYVGDVIFIDGKIYTVKNENELYKNGKYVAKINTIWIRERLRLTIESPSGQLGYYIEI